MVTYKFDTDGGFYSADVEAGIASYAYPTSEYATLAKRNPQRIADEIVAHDRMYMLSSKRANELMRERFEYLYGKMVSL